MKRLILAVVLSAAMLSTGCPKGTKALATASDAVAHGLLNAQSAVKLGVQNGTLTAQEDQNIEVALTRFALAGKVLDDGIRANESATTLSAKVNSFLDAFNQLNTGSVAGIKNPQEQLAISTIVTGIESSVAIIAATVGGK